MFGEENIHEDLVNTTSKYHAFIKNQKVEDFL